LDDVPVEYLPKLLAAKWFNQTAWNLTFLYGWLENLVFSTISASGNAYISSWIMVIYLLVKKEDATGPDLEEKLSDGKYKLSLIDGTFFHYF
jgi:hypothetical protein